MRDSGYTAFPRRVSQSSARYTHTHTQRPAIRVVSARKPYNSCVHVYIYNFSSLLRCVTDTGLHADARERLCAVSTNINLPHISHTHIHTFFVEISDDRVYRKPQANLSASMIVPSSMHYRWAINPSHCAKSRVKCEAHVRVYIVCNIWLWIIQAHRGQCVTVLLRGGVS